ncbi:MAG: hypothetical protein HYV07_27620 [Deltaproteobacteria bacterium]|nr:hypothetical protein [Deltaproteobacteria bacterium]
MHSEGRRRARRTSTLQLFTAGVGLISAATSCNQATSPPEPECTVAEDCGNLWTCEASNCVPLPGDGGGDDAPGSGRAYILDDLAISDQQTETARNTLSIFGPVFNDQLRQGILGGEVLNLFEPAGADEDFPNLDSGVEVRAYPAIDADDPFFPANNFQVPMGETRCCEFKIEPSGLVANPSQPRSRVPGSITDHLLSTTAPGDLDLDGWDQLSSDSGTSADDLRIAKARIEGRVTDMEITDGVIFGALTIHDLASRDNPYCKTLNQLCPRQLPDSTYLDLITVHVLPDVDLDGDGLETLETDASARIAVCYDGDRTLVPPVIAEKPWTCALRPQMADAFSITLRFSAVRASIIGTGN